MMRERICDGQLPEYETGLRRGDVHCVNLTSGKYIDRFVLSAVVYDTWNHPLPDGGQQKLATRIEIEGYCVHPNLKTVQTNMILIPWAHVAFIEHLFVMDKKNG